MVKAYVGGILLALLALGYVTSAAQELPNQDNPEQLVEDALDENGYDQLEAVEDTAPLSTTDDEIEEQQEQLDDVLPKQEEVEEKQEEVEEQQRSSIVFSGNNIALQPLYDKRNYLGCANSPCRKANCPGLYMEGTDWTRCWGEVFQIYRRSGPGAVRVGDYIGIYYPRERGRWFGCPGRLCGKLTCPGYPNIRYGFSSSSKWISCWGEVFRIYARGKSMRAVIHSHDHVFLYYPRARNWVGMVGTYADHRTCPGTSFPPAKNKYDRCWGEVLELTKRQRRQC